MESLYYLQIQSARGIGKVAQQNILQYLRTHHIGLQTFFSLSCTDWRKAGLTLQQIQALQDATALAEQWKNDLDAKHIQIIGCLDPRYPPRLHHVLKNQAPFVLYVWGNTDLLAQPSISFCGSRHATEQGIAVARDVASQVAQQGWSIVSGHARGIDTTTHQTALECGSTTIIVAPEGILNFRLRREIKPLVTSRNTLVVSEFQPSAQWSVDNAMTRNRTICGLSNALVVVQSGKKGGTFEAGKFALQANIPLFVAEYAQTAENAPGNPYFLQHGAHSLRRHQETGQAMLHELFQEIWYHYDNKQEPRLMLPNTMQKPLPLGEPF